ASLPFDAASCFGPAAAASQYPSCACGPAAVAGLCAAEGASCASTACCDCQGLTCVTDSVSGTVCRQPCTSNSDCATRWWAELLPRQQLPDVRGRRQRPVLLLRGLQEPVRLHVGLLFREHPGRRP